MDCKAYRNEIESADRQAQMGAGLEEHLRLCVGCRKFYDERTALRRLVGDLEQVSAPPDFDFRLRARLAEAKSGHRGRRPFQWRFAPSALSIALAACFAITVAVTLRIKNARQTAAEMATAPGAARIDERVNTPSAPSPQPALQPAASPVTAAASGVSAPAGFNETQAHAGLTASVRRRVAPDRAPDRRPTAALVSPPGASRAAGTIVNSDIAVRSAPVMSMAAPATFPVSASARPLKVVVRDESGAARVVSIEAVSFGSQGIVKPSANTSTTVRGTLTTKEGVW